MIVCCNKFRVLIISKVYNTRNNSITMNIKRVNKRGQILGMPFSVIFSIILIVCFIVAAIIAIKIFWNPVGCGTSDEFQEGLFKENLQSIINDVWNSDSASLAFNISLPGKISRVCFLDSTKAKKGKDSEFYDELIRVGRKNNIFLYPPKVACEDFRAFKLEHIDIENITSSANPYCIDARKSIWLEQEFYGNRLVKIK